MGEQHKPVEKGAAAGPFDHIVATSFDGGEGVLVDLNTKQYYQLNETAMLVWRGLEDGQSIDEIVNAMTAAYDVSRAHADTSVDNILRSFSACKLLKPR